MAQRDLTETVVVLDLDDTLYKEADYQDSGLSQVCKWIEDLYGKNIREELFSKKIAGEKDLLGAACSLVGLPLTVKESLLWIYRLHVPNIQLKNTTRELLGQLEEACKIVAILTDGRSISQRIKLRTLGLAHLPVYISEEYSSEKPLHHRFSKIMQDYSANHYIYVGDNPAKDFVAPNMLGWTTLCLLGDDKNIHQQFLESYSKHMMPARFIEDLSQVFDEMEH